MRAYCLSLALFFLPLHAAESKPPFPLWDGTESVAAYAARVKLPPTKSIDLGNGFTLDLVLIPAGKFMMGSAEPQKPSVTVEGAQMLLAAGGAPALLLLAVLVYKKVKTKKRSFSLRWLLLFTAACGLAAGGGARWRLANQEVARYAAEMRSYDGITGSEKPGHSVILTQPFYMGKYTVTQAQYEAVTGSNPSHFKGAQLPVEQVSWDDAKAYCKTLNILLRSQAFEARLPTEAQWEYACRAGTRTAYYAGDHAGDLDAAAWFNANSGNTTHPIGAKKPNAFGLYDMHGNVWQWCEDAYKDHYEELQATDPFNEQGEARDLRGGSWSNNPWYCRSGNRDSSNPGVRYDVIGFRVAVVVPLAK